VTLKAFFFARLGLSNDCTAEYGRKHNVGHRIDQVSNTDCQARSISEYFLELRSQFVRVEGDWSANPVKAKIADAETAKVHTMLVVGQRDLEAGAVSVRLHGKGNVGAKPRAEVVADLLASIRERRA
jgi:threonyl-tRNA synthetase